MGWVRAFGVGLLVAAAACNDREDRPAAGSGGSASAAGSSAGSSTGEVGSASGAGASAGSSAGETGAAGAGASATAAGASAALDPRCEGFDDEPLLAPVHVRITNATTAAIYVAAPEGTCLEPSEFRVADAFGNEFADSTMCRETCQSIIERPLRFCEPLCHERVAVHLEPGASIVRSWSGIVSVDAVLPGGCSIYKGAVECHRQRNYRSGAYTFSAKAGTALECHASIACSDCIPDASGVCFIDSTSLGDDILSAELAVELDPETDAYSPAAPLELVFQTP